MSTSRSFPQPLDWRRVGALSSSFSLHVLAVALALLAVTRSADDPLRIVAPPAEPMQVELVSQPPEAAVPERPQTPPEVMSTPLPRHVAEAHAAPAPQPVETSPVVQDAPAAVDAAVTESLPAVRTPAPPASTGVEYENVRLPGYPAIARRQGLRGETVLRVLVGVSGAAERIEVSRSSGHRVLDRAAIASVRTWRFRPAMENGVAIASWVEVPVAFRLDAR